MMGREPPQVDAFADTWMAAPTTPGGLAVQPGARAPLPDATSAGLLLLLYSAALDPAPAAGPPACWARAQLRYALGAAGRSLVVGWGPGPPLRAASPAASCAASVRPCNGTRAGSAALAAAAPNPHVLVGALVAGPAAGAGDAYEDVRAAPDAALSRTPAAALRARWRWRPRSATGPPHAMRGRGSWARWARGCRGACGRWGRCSAFDSACACRNLARS